jgi:putative SOS response-associated peptidase YedK
MAYIGRNYGQLSLLPESKIMCSRYSITAKAEDVASRFAVDIPESFYKSNYNAAPSQLLPVITSDSSQGLSLFYWGLPPERSKNRSITERIINLRAEAIHEKPVYKKVLRNNRCLIPADGYYEWKKIGKKSTIPYRIIRKDRSLFAFAGIWEEFEDESGDSRHTFSIITVPGNALTASVHERMPLILNREAEGTWLNAKASEAELLAVLIPYPADLMDMYTVSSRVNSVQSNDGSLILPAPAADQYGNLTLFD